jgi:hypothetical protein
VKLTNSAIVLEFVLVDAAFARSSDITGVHCSQLTFDALGNSAFERPLSRGGLRTLSCSSSWFVSAAAVRPSAR